jgi:hypothetical protein
MPTPSTSSEASNHFSAAAFRHAVRLRNRRVGFMYGDPIFRRDCWNELGQIRAVTAKKYCLNLALIGASYQICPTIQQI